jgi:hypothetical protein
MRILALTTALAALLASVASAAPSHKPMISQNSIAGIHLGMTKAQSLARLGTGTTTRQGTYDNPGQPGDWTAIVSDKRKVAVYFEPGVDEAIMVTTWNRAYKSAAGAGPCLPIAHLKKLYRSTVKPNPHNTIDGKVYAYEVGKNLIFAADGRPPNPSPVVTAVGLYRGADGDEALGFAGFVTDSERDCG